MRDNGMRDNGTMMALVLVALGAGISLARLERAVRADGSLSEFGPGFYQDASQAVWRKGKRFDLELPWRVGAAVFEPRQNMESVALIGYVSSIAYHGFAVWMTIGDYLELNPPCAKDAQRLAWFYEQMEAGKPMGPPWLDLQATAFDAQDAPTAFLVRSHEGRHRMMALGQLVGMDTVVPVYCTVRSHRARHLRHDALIGAILTHDPRSLMARKGRPPLSIQRITLDGICY